MNPDRMMGTMHGIDGPQLSDRPIVGLTEERSDLALPLAHFRAQHLDPGGLEDCSAIVEVEVVASANRLDNG